MESIELQRRKKEAGLELPMAEGDPGGGIEPLRPKALSLTQLKPKDQYNFFFLSLLYYLQGIPVGLAFGSVPFILKEKLSYGEIGIFTFASYPYSLKLLWSPIVDAFFWPSFGRRRSWIVPVQAFSTVVLFWLAMVVEPMLENTQKNLMAITTVFFVLVLAAATQDIAVDGWALTLLSKPALPYASTAQTIGMNAGYFTSFTVFLAVSSPELANKYFRTVPQDYGLVTFSMYLRACAVLYFIVTVFVAYGVKEDNDWRAKNPWESTKLIYKQMLGVLKLDCFQKLVLVHLVAKIAFQAAEAVTNLKLVEKGLSKEDLALIVLIDFPFEIIFGYYAAEWSTKVSPLQPWLWAYAGRIVFAMVSMTQVLFFPKNGATFPYLVYITIVHVLGSFLSTVQFVSVSAFHTQIADPEIGGTYMTFLNTVCNFGGQWPRALVLFGVDYFTKATCSNGLTCSTSETRAKCKEIGGTCTVHYDGYYIMNVTCVVVGLVIFYTYIKRTLEKLQHLPTSAWRAQ